MVLLRRARGRGRGLEWVCELGVEEEKKVSVRRKKQKKMVFDVFFPQFRFFSPGVPRRVRVEARVHLRRRGHVDEPVGDRELLLC
jgi:hypothetical protein